MSFLVDVLRFFGMWIPALAACVLGSVPVAVGGLSVSGWLVFPLAFAWGGLLAALIAGSIGNLVFTGRGTRSRLLPIVGWTELIAAVVFGLFVLAFFSRWSSLVLGTELLVSAALITTGAVLMTFRLRV